MIIPLGNDIDIFYMKKLIKNRVMDGKSMISKIAHIENLIGK
jgi:hypothetical protein